MWEEGDTILGQFKADLKQSQNLTKREFQMRSKILYYQYHVMFVLYKVKEHKVQRIGLFRDLVGYIDHAVSIS